MNSSVPGSTPTEAILQDIALGQFSNQTIYAAIAFLAYSYLVLLDREVPLVWLQPKRASSWLYALIRYPGLLSQLIQANITVETPNCNVVYDLANWSLFVALTATYVFQILRTFAVCGRRKSLAVSLMVLACPTLALQIWASAKATCYATQPLSATANNIAITTDILFEFAVVFATVKSTWGQVKEARDAKLSHGTLADTILRNGLVYFGAFLVTDSEIINLVTVNLNQTTPVNYTILLTQAFAYPLRFALSCQFILELRERAAKRSDTDISLPTVSSFHATVLHISAALEVDLGEASQKMIVGSILQGMSDSRVEQGELRDVEEQTGSGEPYISGFATLEGAAVP